MRSTHPQTSVTPAGSARKGTSDLSLSVYKPVRKPLQNLPRDSIFQTSSWSNPATDGQRSKLGWVPPPRWCVDIWEHHVVATVSFARPTKAKAQTSLEREAVRRGGGRIYRKPQIRPDGKTPAAICSNLLSSRPEHYLYYVYSPFCTGHQDIRRASVDLLFLARRENAERDLRRMWILERCLSVQPLRATKALATG